MKRIVLYPHPSLRVPSIPVDFERDKNDLPHFADDLVETCFRANGAAIAAIQIQLPLRLIVIMNDGELPNVGPFIVVANPVIESWSDVVETENEGCLSFPGQEVRIARPKAVKLVGRDIYGEPQRYLLDGIMARAAQHEIEHLDAKLLIDHALEPQKTAIDATMRRLSKSRERVSASTSPVPGDGE